MYTCSINALMNSMIKMTTCKTPNITNSMYSSHILKNSTMCYKLIHTTLSKTQRKHNPILKILSPCPGFATYTFVIVNQSTHTKHQEFNMTIPTITHIKCSIRIASKNKSP